ncbi:34627_t:CDS:2 [Gigaspora margarita]|uniref:34627_t:CDS:1 n=1 Tax=Gigaspora margarita TaxID=4874 RepID=A0ABN7VJN4_GIGMA|nr:34627_t:CDS:2 [Gigaspora margarita]
MNDLTTINHDSIPVGDSKEGPNLIKRSIRVQTSLLGVVLIGSSLVMSDGLLTPAVSVISAVEGMAVPAPNLTPAIVPISCVILIVLFLLQQFGTGKVGTLFAPIVFLWFLAIACVGIWNISQYPEIFGAYNPYYAFDYFIRKQDAGFTDLGGILLAITGVEALFADLGHFNQRAIQISFSLFVYIPLVLVYTGQAARLVLDPTVIANTFWLTTPSDPVIYWIIFILAILATIIASQAMISATFSLIYQSMQLDCFPRVKVIHTSEKVEGQIYIPETPDFDKIFKGENFEKFEILEKNLDNVSHEITLENSNEIMLGNDNENISIDTGFTRSPGIGLFYSDIGTKIPLSFTQFVKHFPIIPQNLVFINIQTVADPKVGDSDRLNVEKVKNYEGCYQVTARYGYLEQVSQGREFLLLLVESIRKIDPINKNLTHDFNPDNDSVTYIVGQQSLCSKPDTPWWARILIGVYMFIYFNSRTFYSNWDIPVENTVVVGVKISI